MKKFLYIFCLIVVSFSFSQEKDLKIETKKITKGNINPLSPAKAAFYSAILPGLGQAYNKRYWKVPVVYAAIGTGVYFVIDNNKKYNSFRDEYKGRTLNNSTVAINSDYEKLSNESVVRGMKFYQKNRDLSVLITAGIYILNIIDANVDAHLLQFNVNDDLTLKPDLQTNPYTFKQNVGLTLTYQF